MAMIVVAFVSSSMEVDVVVVVVFVVSLLHSFKLGMCSFSGNTEILTSTSPTLTLNRHRLH